MYDNAGYLLSPYMGACWRIQCSHSRMFVMCEVRTYPLIGGGVENTYPLIGGGVENTYPLIGGGVENTYTNGEHEVSVRSDKEKTF
jgi:hypothetical protein